MKRLLPVVRLGCQRADADCAIVALAMLTGSSYEDIIGLASAFLKEPHRRGMYLRDVKAIAATLGYRLTYTRKERVNLETDTGLLCVECSIVKRARPHHMVLLRWGLVFDDSEVWEPEVYMEMYEAKVTSLLMVREG